jgi:hypothetical protein
MKIKRSGSMAQVVESLPRKLEAEFKLHYYKKKEV